MKRDRPRARRTKGLASAVLTFTGLAVFALSAGTAGAVGTLDQSQEEGATPGPGAIVGVAVGQGTPTDAAQTFTAGITGDLDQVDLFLGRPPFGPRGPMTIELQSTSGGTPDGVVLATAVVQPEAVPPGEGAWVPIPIDPVPVTQGTQYAIVAKGSGGVPSGTAFVWGATFTDPYPEGGSLISPGGQGAWEPLLGVEGIDNNFRTYVTPAPSPPDPPGQPCKLVRLSIGVFGPPIVICI